MTGIQGSWIRRWLERGLIVTGVLLLSWSAMTIVEARHQQRQLRTDLNRALAGPGSPAAPPASLKRGAMVGSLEIPRLKLTAMVVEGDDDQTLKRGVGHLPDTPLPWEKGNAALAGHRDTFLRAMRNISANDEIRLTTPHGASTYRVREIAVVTPDNTTGLSITDDSSLTLITCYPFSYIGNAPKRFVVRAARTHADPSARSTTPASASRTPKK
jgi:sortase A